MISRDVIAELEARIEQLHERLDVEHTNHVALEQAVVKDITYIMAVQRRLAERLERLERHAVTKQFARETVK